MYDLQRQVDHIAEHLSSGEYDFEPGDYDEPCAGDYLKDALDIEYIISSDKSYLGARVLVTFGGPNIWINTRTMTVEGYSRGERAQRAFDDRLGLDEWLEEYWECIK
tara:strand:- start:1778 stop:2098 length:321 start_codon:yes stop_codon:yes gene_type:complete